MTNKYGPWATLIDAGGNPQLSAFWRRRLTMLVPVSQTSTTLEWHNLLLLVVTGIITCVLPTFLLSPAAAEEKKPADSQSSKFVDTTEAPRSGAEGSTPSGESSADADNPHKMTIPPKDIIELRVYNFLLEKRNRKKINITDEQENKLRDIAGNIRSENEKIGMEFQSMSSQEQNAKYGEIQARVSQLTTNVRKQVEDVLTADQLKALKNATLYMRIYAAVALGQPISEKIILNAKQKNDLDKLQGETTAKIHQLIAEQQGKSFAVLNTQQREKLISRHAKDYYVGPVISIPSINSPRFITLPTTNKFLQSKYSYHSSGGAFLGVYQALNEEDICKEIGLDAEQQKKLQEISDKYEGESKKVFKSFEPMDKLSPEERKSRESEYRRKLEEMGKDICGQIEGVLTPRQLETSKESVIRKLASSSLFFSDADINPEILNYISASPEQQEKLRQIRDEFSKIEFQLDCETGEKSLQVFTPQQLDKLKEELDNQGW